MKMYEQMFDVITQGVRMKTVSDVVRNGKSQVMENIVNKANLKLGGKYLGTIVIAVENRIVVLVAHIGQQRAGESSAHFRPQLRRQAG